MITNAAILAVRLGARFVDVTCCTVAGCTLSYQRRGVVIKGTAKATGRLVVVHWHAVVRKGLAAWISQEPYVQLVGVASTCEDALDIAAELHPDLVLLGYSTPKMGGIEATRRLIEMRGQTRVILLGTSGGSERSAEAIENGAMDYLLLDTPPWEIAATVRRLVEE